MPGLAVSFALGTVSRKPGVGRRVSPPSPAACALPWRDTPARARSSASRGPKPFAPASYEVMAQVGANAAPRRGRSSRNSRPLRGNRRRACCGA